MYTEELTLNETEHVTVMFPIQFHFNDVTLLLIAAHAYMYACGWSQSCITSMQCFVSSVTCNESGRVMTPFSGQPCVTAAGHTVLFKVNRCYTEISEL